MGRHTYQGEAPPAGRTASRRGAGWKRVTALVRAKLVYSAFPGRHIPPWHLSSEEEERKDASSLVLENNSRFSLGGRQEESN